MYIFIFTYGSIHLCHIHLHKIYIHIIYYNYYIIYSIYYYGFFIGRESIADKFYIYKFLIIISLSRSYLLSS